MWSGRCGWRILWRTGSMNKPCARLFGWWIAASTNGGRPRRVSTSRRKLLGATMRKLSLLDLAFFVAESGASPKHVAGLLIFKKPPKAGASFVKNLYRDYLAATDVKAPFNRVIQFSLSAMPSWRTLDKVDLSQHIFYDRLDKGYNDRRALYRCLTNAGSCHSAQAQWGAARPYFERALAIR